MSPLEAALAYAQGGWLVFPVRPGLKKPATLHGHLEATTDEKQIREWWTAGCGWENCNIGVVTSRVSGIWVLDCDIDKETGELGEDTLDAMIKEFGELPPHPIARTPRGGRHHIFAWPPDGGDLPRMIRGLPGLDVLGSRMEDAREVAGYFIAAPSVRTDGKYEWEVWPGEVDNVPAPDWLIDRLRSAGIKQRPEPHTPIEPIWSPTTTPYGRKALEERCREVTICPPGRQEVTLGEDSVRIGSLSARGHIEHGEAFSSLVAAAMQMVNGGKPWTRSEIEKKVRRGMVSGARDPSGPSRSRQPLAV